MKREYWNFHQVFSSHLQSISNEPEKSETFNDSIVLYFYTFLLQFYEKEKERKGSSFPFSRTMKFEIENRFAESATSFAFIEFPENLY